MNAPPMAGRPLFEASNIIPRLHLSNLTGNPAPVLALVSDSTGLPGSALGGCGQVSASQCLWAALKDGFRRQNPQARFNFDTLGPDAGNFAIGGAGWQHVLKTGEETKLRRPAWFTAPAASWLAHVEAAGPDVLVFNLGINFGYAGYGPHGGHNVLFHIAAVLAEIGTWAKSPNVIFITNKQINSATRGGEGSFRPGPLPAYLGAAAAVRTIARSNGALLSEDAPAELRRFGLIDIGRYHGMQVLGKDCANQYFAAVPDAAGPRAITQAPVPLGHSADGDFAFTAVFPGRGAAGIFRAGVRRIQIQLGAWTGQVLTLHFADAAGGFLARYTPVHFTAAQRLTGPAIRLPTGDLRLGVECRQERLIILINGQEYLAASVPRLICEGPVTMWSLEAPAAPILCQLLSFYEGRALACQQAMNEDAVFGAYDSGTVAANGPYGGNGVNHPSSLGVALTDYPVIGASNLAAG